MHHAYDDLLPNLGFATRLQNTCNLPISTAFWMVYRFEAQTDAATEIPLQIHFEIPLEIRCEISPEISPRIPLELSLELHLEIRFEIPPAILLEIPDGIFQIIISNAS